MLSFRPVLYVVGLLLSTMSIGMCIPAAVDLYFDNPGWQVFATSAGLTLFIGVGLALTNHAPDIRLTVRQAFVLTTASWVVLTVFAALPLTFSELNLSYTDAFFEAMSGVTTTGSTVIVGLDTAPPGVLLWRSMLQWLGGIGIVVMAIGVMPMLRVGGMQLFRTESSEKSEKAMPRVTQIVTAIILIYLGLSVVWTGLYWAAGMSFFDGVIHAMTTLATGGFSSHDNSVGQFDDWRIDLIATCGMFIGGLPFVLILRTIQGGKGALFADTQVRTYGAVVVVLILACSAFLWLRNGVEPLQALRYASFNLISVMTGTGYATSDFYRWGSFAVPLFFFVMFIGGCAGSTTCGMKIFRFQVLYAAARTQIRHLFQPHGVFIPYYNHRPIPSDVIESVLSFFFVFILCFGILAIGLGMLGLDYLTAISGAATAICNVGPGLGDIIGPAGNFSTLPDAAKWMLSAGMLLGRLELFTVIVLFSRTFWRG
ncbi:TrkH family potassium uptake protein [Shumkonia mesophila]|uniref:TrkH family potassium uptake protein n=1 Tax=Shumkonia mesophila TaxID=2838854 RepID=UPI002934C983|nr:TrkH family potassium uptake protein [Shumkonia mesophila]